MSEEARAKLHQEQMVRRHEYRQRRALELTGDDDAADATWEAWEPILDRHDAVLDEDEELPA